MTSEQIQDAAELHKLQEIHKAIDITNSIAKAIEASKRAAVVQIAEFSIPEYKDSNLSQQGEWRQVEKF